MMFRKLFLIVLMSVGTVSGQTVVLTETGAYLLTKDAENKPSYTLLGTDVIDLRGDVPDKPDDKPKIDLELANKIKACSEDLDDPDGAQVIAKVYAHVRNALQDDILNTETVWKALKDGTDKALEKAEAIERWGSCRDMLGEDLAEREQRGRMRTKKEIVLYLRSIQSGLEASVDGSFAISTDLEVAVAAVVNEAIDEHK